MNEMEITIKAIRDITYDAKLIKSDDDYKRVLNKYDLIISGEKINTIDSTELRHCLKNVYNCEISHDEFLKLISIVCTKLNLKKEGLYLLENTNVLNGYLIHLF
ncbi:hypothetical protein [Virgibacillus sp. Bac332]|uniref:hypothetical protein n=1 Tax=Virgibacillus sp. Bac332 TaxID=2419842 RepID=UPI000EF4502F|nr:hypothetical protein [Virgibacillus sp. Bac332]